MGISISCSGTATDGEEDGQKCKVVESLDECHSVDFVARPAAGGRVDAIESVERRPRIVSGRVFLQSVYLQLRQHWRLADPRRMAQGST